MKCYEYAKKIIDRSKDGRPLPHNWMGGFKDCEDYPHPKIVEFYFDSIIGECTIGDVRWIGRLPSNLAGKKWKIVATEVIE